MGVKSPFHLLALQSYGEGKEVIPVKNKNEDKHNLFSETNFLPQT